MNNSLIKSRKLIDIENAIRDDLQASTKSIIKIGLYLNLIEEEDLFYQYNCQSMAEYIRRQTIIPYSTAQEYLTLGYNWSHYKENLKKLGFREERGVSNLKFIPRRIEKEKIEFTLKKALELSSRDFRKFVSQELKKKTVRTVLEKEKNKFNEKDIVDVTISYINRKKENSMMANLFAIEIIKDLFKELVDLGVLEDNLYKFLMEQTK